MGDGWCRHDPSCLRSQTGTSYSHTERCEAPADALTDQWGSQEESCMMRTAPVKRTMIVQIGMG